MNLLKLKITIVFLFSLGIIINAQQTNPATGGNASGNGGSASYSVGQVFYISSNGTTGSVSQGIQQAYEITVETGIDDLENITLLCSAFPNPTTDYINLKVNSKDLKALSYYLFDINGKLLDSKKLDINEVSIDMSTYISATYFLKIIQNNKEIKSFKIIKY
jgi:hypothetical protein